LPCFDGAARDGAEGLAIFPGLALKEERRLVVNGG
jgi:hypothetical protein